jgi:hypothetical protein
MRVFTTMEDLMKIFDFSTDGMEKNGYMPIPVPRRIQQL